MGELRDFKRFIEDRYSDVAAERGRVLRDLVASMAQAQDEWDAMVDSGKVPTQEEAEAFAEAMEKGQRILTEADINWGAH